MTWITGLPASGTSTGEWDNTTITISAVGLAVGTYTRTITISAVGVPSQTITVNLTVTQAPAMEITPSELNITLEQGQTTTRTISVRNSGGGSLNWNITVN